MPCPPYVASTSKDVIDFDIPPLCGCAEAVLEQHTAAEGGGQSCRYCYLVVCTF